MTKKRRLPVSRFLTPCPDCCAEHAGNKLLHEMTCPLQAGVEAACDADRAYFRDHPGEQEYTRPISRAERQQMQHIDPGREASHVIVANHPWGRSRCFVDNGFIGSMMLDPDSGVA